MRNVYFILVCLSVSASVFAGEIDDVEGLRLAISTHNAALLSGERTQVSKTVVFPHVQFYPDGRVVVTQQESDLPDQGEPLRFLRRLISSDQAAMADPRCS